MDSAATTLRVGRAELAIVPSIGGGVARFTVAGTDVLRRTTDDAIAAGDVRALACYPLVPYSNRIANARLAIGARTYELSRNFGLHPHAIHGVGWQRRWNVVSREPDRLLLELVHRPEGDDASAWPFSFRAFQAFELAEQDDVVAVTLTLGIASNDTREFPFGLGFHPFFPKPKGTSLAFVAKRVWRTDPTRLPTELVPIPDEWQFASKRPLEGLTLDNVFVGWDGGVAIDWPSERCRATIEADRALSHLVVYVPPDGAHFAVEPVTHMTDAFNRASEGAGDTGTRTVPTGGAFSCTMRLTVHRDR